MEYSEEPEINFLPVNKKRYCQLYDLEMSTFTNDINFYLKSAKSSNKILELGCGSGRLSQHLAKENHSLVALDISHEMLKLATFNCSSNIDFICMDMLSFSFSTTFDTIIIPYNTLNLCTTSEKAKQCLQLCREHLSSNGNLLLQLFIPDTNLQLSTAKTFQFQIFSPPEGGKIIKETLKQYDRHSQTLLLEERYRVRPFHKNRQNEDLVNFLSLFAPDYPTWKTLIQKCGFSVDSAYGDYNFIPYSPESNLLLLCATAK